MPIAFKYLAINAIIFLLLSILVVRQRMKHRISLGDGNNQDLQQATRAFGNNAEYLSVVILLLVALETMKGPSWVIHVLGICYTIGRIIHALAIYGRITGPSRVIGMSLTYTVLFISSIYLLWLLR